MQLTISDLTTMMQKLDPKHNINLFRKQYGNTEKCLKEVKKPIFILDNMVVKLKPYDAIKSLHSQGVMLDNHWNNYDKTYAENELKKIEVLKINGQNVCKTCGETYKTIINKMGICGEEKGIHQPLHNF